MYSILNSLEMIRKLLYCILLGLYLRPTEIRLPPAFKLHAMPVWLAPKPSFKPLSRRYSRNSRQGGILLHTDVALPLFCGFITSSQDVNLPPWLNLPRPSFSCRSVIYCFGVKGRLKMNTGETSNISWHNANSVEGAQSVTNRLGLVEWYVCATFTGPWTNWNWDQIIHPIKYFQNFTF